MSALQTASLSILALLEITLRRGRGGDEDVRLAADAEVAELLEAASQRSGVPVETLVARACRFYFGHILSALAETRHAQEAEEGTR